MIIKDIILPTNISDYNASILCASIRIELTSAVVVARPTVGENNVTVRLIAFVVISNNEVVNYEFELKVLVE